MRLDKLVMERFGLSRRAAMEAVRNGQVDVDGLCCLEPGHDVAPETPVDLRPQPASPAPRAATLRVLFEDGHILIVDKPAGLLTQPTQERERDTLLERAGRYLARKHGIQTRTSGSCTGSTRTPRA